MKTVIKSRVVPTRSKREFKYNISGLKLYSRRTRANALRRTPKNLSIFPAKGLFRV